MTAYTDDDVTAVVDLELLLSREEAELILAAVAPAIAARALREAAEEWERGPNMVNGAVFVDFLRARGGSDDSQ